MTIGVQTTTDCTVNYEDATGWHVDETGALHITKTGSGNVATFHPGAWAFVNRSPEDAPTDEPHAVSLKDKVAADVVAWSLRSGALSG